MHRISGSENICVHVYFCALSSEILVDVFLLCHDQMGCCLLVLTQYPTKKRCMHISQRTRVTLSTSGVFYVHLLFETMRYKN